MYPCVMCKYQTHSVADLHCHQMQTHTLEELSFSIINIQGLATMDSLMFIKPKSFAEYHNSFHAYNVRMRNSSCRNRRSFETADFEEDTCMSMTHDQADCLLNCNPFIPWEKELYKGITVNDEEFVNCVTALCNDLASIAHKPKKKRWITEKNCKTEEANHAAIGKLEVCEQMQVVNDAAGCLETIAANEHCEIASKAPSDDPVEDIVDNKRAISAEILKIIGIDYDKDCIEYDLKDDCSFWNVLG